MAHKLTKAPWFHRHGPGPIRAHTVSPCGYMTCHEWVGRRPGGAIECEIIEASTASGAVTPPHSAHSEPCHDDHREYYPRRCPDFHPASGSQTAHHSKSCMQRGSSSRRQLA